MGTFPLYRHGGLSPFFVVLESGSYGGIGRKPRGPSLFRNYLRGGSNSNLCGKLCATMEKLQPLATMGGKVFDPSVPFQVAWVY